MKSSAGRCLLDFYLLYRATLEFHETLHTHVLTVATGRYCEFQAFVAKIDLSDAEP